MSGESENLAETVAETVAEKAVEEDYFHDMPDCDGDDEVATGKCYFTKISLTISSLVNYFADMFAI